MRANDVRLPASLLLIRAFPARKAAQSDGAQAPREPGHAGARASGHPLRAAPNLNDQEFLHNWMRRCTVLEHSGRYGERDGIKKTRPGAQYSVL